MLKGNNTFQFNQSTMIEMIQFYFNNKLFNKDETAPCVYAVKARNSGGGIEVFEVETREDKV